MGGGRSRGGTCEDGKGRRKRGNPKKGEKAERTQEVQREIKRQ